MDWTKLRNKIQLITYPDSLGKDLKGLNTVLTEVFPDYLFGGVHILPFFPSSHDRGFAPLNQLEVDKNHGTWDDIKTISSKFDVMVDLIVNHLSSESKFFKDYLETGKTEYFLPVDKIVKTKEDWEWFKTGIWRPRPTPPYFEYEFKVEPKIRKLWCTFSKHHIDLDWTSQKVHDLMEDTLNTFCKNGVDLVRLDAVPFLHKIKGTNCFFTDKCYEEVDWMKSVVKKGGYNTEFLTEVHGTPQVQMDLAKRVDMTYDFALPMLCLHAFFYETSDCLYKWYGQRPTNVCTTLDTHDGIGVVDTKTLIPDKEADKTVDHIFEVADGCKHATGESSDNLDIYQVNTTYWDAIERSRDAYLAARAIQFFHPGIPQVYYTGLLCGENDIELLKKTGVGRAINRHDYEIDEIKKEMEKSDVKDFFKLIKFRNSCEAFNGKCTIPEKEKRSKKMMEMTWTNDKDVAKLVVDLEKNTFNIEHSVGGHVKFQMS